MAFIKIWISILAILWFWNQLGCPKIQKFIFLFLVAVYEKQLQICIQKDKIYRTK